jgi:nicotinamidase-related amidase
MTMKQAVLVIDFQQELVDGNIEERPVYLKEHVAHIIEAVVLAADDRNIPVVFIRDLYVAGGTRTGLAVHDLIPVPTSSVTFDKTATNAFHGTPLLDHLRQASNEHLIVLGCKSEHCIDTAVRSATVHGFDVTLVADGHTTNGSDVLTPEQMIAHHNPVLHGHYNVEHFSIVRRSTEDVFTPIHNDYRT